MKRKKLWALLMAVVMLISSVTISYKMSEADEPPTDVVSTQLTFTFGNDFIGRDVSVSINHAQFSEKDHTETLTVDSEGKITTSNHEYYANESYVATFTATVDDKDYIGTINLTTPASGTSSMDGGNVTMSLSTYDSVLIVLDKLYDSGITVDGFNVEQVEDGSVTKITISKASEEKISVGDSVTINATKDGINYSQSVVITSDNMSSVTITNVVSYNLVTLNLGYNYNNVEVKLGGTKVADTTDGVSSITINSTINKGANLTVTGTRVSDGLGYTASVNVSSNSITISESAWTATQYILKVNNDLNDSSSDIVYNSTNIEKIEYLKDGSYITLSNDLIFDKGSDITIRVTGKKNQVITGVSGVERTLTDTTSADWQEQLTFTINDKPNTQIKLETREPKLVSVKFADNDNVSGGKYSTVPAITNSIGIAYKMETYSGSDTYPLPSGVKYKIVSSDSNYVTVIQENDDFSFILTTDYKEISEFDSVSLSLEADTTTGIDITGVTIDSPLGFAVSEDVLIYQEDFGIPDETVVLYAVEAGKKIFYKASNSDVIEVYDKNYDKYRYSNSSDTPSGAYSNINANSNIPITADGTIRIQMEKTDSSNLGIIDKYGVGQVELVNDSTPPDVSFDGESDLSKISIDSKDYYVVNGDSSITVTATDSGSGMKKIYVSYDSEVNITVGTDRTLDAVLRDLALLGEISSGDSIIANGLEDGAHSVYVYAVDNVGNIREEVKYIYKDTESPILTLNGDSVGDDWLWLNENNLVLLIEAYDEGSGLAYLDENDSKFKQATDVADNSVDIKLEELDETGAVVRTISKEDMKQDNDIVENFVTSTEPYTYTADIKIPETDGITYNLKIKTQDTAGNVTDKTVKIVVDTTAPVISEFALDEFAVENNTSIIGATNTGKYKFKVTEANLLKVELQYELNGTNKTIQLFNEETPDENNVYEFNKLLEEQLINETATVIVYDKAGNEPAKYGFTYSFDKEKVKFVSATNKSAPLAKVSDYEVVGKNAVIEFKIEEQNFREDLFSYEVQKLNGNGEYVSDSTADVTPIFTDDGQNVTITCNIDFASDGRYKVIGYYDDIALYSGAEYNPSSYVSNKLKMEYDKVLVSDNTAPKLSKLVSIDDENDTMTVIYTLIESNPDFASNDFTVTVNKAVNNLGDIKDGVDIYKPDGSVISGGPELIATALKNEANWTKNAQGTIYNIKIVFNTEGEYDVRIKPIDYALHVDSENELNNIFDVTAPKTESLTVTTPYQTGNTDFSQFATGETDKEAELIIKVSDLVSKNTVNVDYEMISQESAASTTTNKQLTLNRTEKNYFEGSVKINPNFKGILKFKYTDTNGNSTTEEIKYDNGIVVENEAQHALTSDVTISDLNAGDARKGIYNEDVRFNLSTIATYSGINKVECTINGVAQSLNGTFDSGNITTAWNQDLVINSDTFEGNEINVVFTVTDNAQFTKTTTATYAIDKTAPVIRVSYDNNAPLNDRYYNATRTATISVDELNFENSDVVITATRNGSSMSIPANFTTDGVQRTNAAGKKYYTYVMNIPFAEDGDYTFTITVTDMAGNTTSYGQTDEFTIDKTNPEIQISYNNNNALNGNYYGEARVATITVNEHNFDPSSVNVNLTAQGAGVPSVSAFSNNGDVHTATVSFSEDADYTISANCVDLAGNESNSIAEDAFTVDLTDPVIEITGVDANESYKGTVNPIVTVTDTNYDLDGVEITIVGGKHGVKDVANDVANTENGQVFTYADIQHIQDNDDSYTITAVATDKAGHSTEATLNYRVNRYGSIYSLNKEFADAVDNYYATSSDKYAIIEENVDEIENYTITYTVDNEITNLSEGQDYSISSDRNNDDWNEYVYSLEESSFTKEGIYNISISSEDVVGNVSDNKSKGLDIEFCIDNTKPVCVISGVSDGQEIERDQAANIVIEAYDNIKFSDMKVEVNGEVLMTEADMEDGKVSFTLNPTTGNQVLKVVCHDAAGNEELQEINFTFDVSVLKSHKSLVIVIIAILALLAAGMTFFIIAKRRRDNN